MEAPPRQGAAFFDFDRTLLHGDAGVIFGWTLWDYAREQGGRLPPGSAERRNHDRQVRTQAVRTLGKGAVYRSLNALGIMKRSRLVELTYRFLEGFPAADMSAHMKRVWHEKLRERIYPHMVDLIERHRKEGRRIVIVTTGLRELVEHSREVLGEDVDVIGVEMRAQEGLWLGRVDGPLYGVHKASAVRDYARKQGVDLAASYAYSDHHSDAAFLDAVGHPVCVNPSLRLQLLARRKGWTILRILPPARQAAEPSSPPAP